MKDRERRAQELISHFKQDVMKLEEEIRLIESRLDKEEFDSKRELMIKSKESSRQNISKLEKSLKFLENNSRGPLKVIESLRTDRRVLEQEISDQESIIRGY